MRKMKGYFDKDSVMHLIEKVTLLTWMILKNDLKRINYLLVHTVEDLHNIVRCLTQVGGHICFWVVVGLFLIQSVPVINLSAAVHASSMSGWFDLFLHFLVQTNVVHYFYLHTSLMVGTYFERLIWNKWFSLFNFWSSLELI